VEEIAKIGVGIAALLLGIPIGNILAMKTKEELRGGQKWFRIILGASLAGGLIGAVFKNDTLMFSFFFIAMVTSRSLRKYRQ